MANGLPWFRTDSHIYANDKFLALLGERGGEKSFVSYIFGLGWSVGHGTDGAIPRHVAHLIRADKARGEQLVEHALWEPRPDGWGIRNFDKRQQTSAMTDSKSALQSQGARKGNCKRFHPQPCNCWEDDQ